MPESSNSLKKNPLPVIIFLLRNGLLYLLMVNGLLHFKEQLNPVFFSIAFILSAGFAFLIHKTRLRIAAAIGAFFIIIFVIRMILFLFFSAATSSNTVTDADFLFFLFDKDFYPALIPVFITGLFNILSLRYKNFFFVEIGLNVLLLIAVFVTEAGYNITMYHPTLFALILLVFILCEVVILILNQQVNLASDSNKARILPFIFMLIPFLILFFFYMFLANKYNQESSKNRGGLMESTLFRFDFSKYLKLQDEIKLSDDLVLLMRKNGPADRMLLRRFILSEYNPQTGFSQDTNKKFDQLPSTVPNNKVIMEDPGSIGREDVEQEYFFVNLDPSSLIAMNYPVQLVPLKNWNASSFLRVYRVTSKVFQETTVSILTYDIPKMDKEQYDFYTDYNNEVRIKKLAMEITQNVGDYKKKVLNIQSYLKNNYLYSLKPGIAADNNQLYHFLFESQKGYCSYFAFAMTLLCRSIGIPARVAVGFYTSPDWEVMNFYEIRAYQAHAWVEVYFGEYGWIEFDPTSSTVAPGEDISFLSKVTLSDKSRQLIEEILDNQDKLQEDSSKTEKIEETRNSRLNEIIASFASWFTRTWYFILPVLYIIIILVIKLKSFILFKISKDIRVKTKHLYRFCLTRLYNINAVKQLSESIKEYADRIESEYKFKTSLLTISYLKALFSLDYDQSDYCGFILNYKQFIQSYNKQVNPVIQLLGFLNPFHNFKKKG